LRTEGLSCTLDVGKLQFLIMNFFSLQFLVITTMDPDWIRSHLKCWIRIHSSDCNYVWGTGHSRYPTKTTCLVGEAEDSACREQGLRICPVGNPEDRGLYFDRIFIPPPPLGNLYFPPKTAVIFAQHSRRQNSLNYSFLRK
jgi:hypothetical protein